VLTTTYDGTVWALDRRDGEVVWRGALPAASIAPVAVTGDTLLTAGGMPLEQGHRLELVAYRLDGDSHRTG
jgi:outer membrane protein assembly factor BamB